MTEAVTEITSKVAKDVYEEAFRRCMQVVEQNIVPDVLVRRGIRYLLSQRVKEVGSKACLQRMETRLTTQLSHSDVCLCLGNLQTTVGGEEYQRRLQEFVDELKEMPVALQVCRCEYV